MRMKLPPLFPVFAPSIAAISSYATTTTPTVSWSQHRAFGDGSVGFGRSLLPSQRNGRQDQAGRDACPDGQAVVGRGGYRDRDRDGFLDHHDAHVCVECAKRIGCRHVEAAPEGASVQPGCGVRRGHVWIHDRGRRGRPDESHDSQHVQLDPSACADGDVPRGRDLDRVGVWLCVHVA